MNQPLSGLLHTVSAALQALHRAFAALDEITLRGCHQQQDLRTKFEAHLQRRST